MDDLFKLDTSIGSRNLKQFEEVINQETFWVASEILKELNALKRMKTIKHFIKIALHCRECKNFNSMFAIIRWVRTVVRWARCGSVSPGGNETVQTGFLLFRVIAYTLLLCVDAWWDTQTPGLLLIAACWLICCSSGVINQK